MKEFLSCDWGLSSFRLRYVRIPGPKFESTESSDQGIAATFDRWKQSGKDNEERFSFYRKIIAEHILILENRLKISLNGVPLVISGMASSSIGMIEVPYKQAPVKADGSDLDVLKIKRGKEFDHDIFIISGVRTDDDVMRGEETQLAGSKANNDANRLYIFPGTHSKHILVKKGNAAGFKTYMTGEFFELLYQKSVLSSSVRSSEVLTKENKRAFNNGVSEAKHSSLLHAAFLVRTNHLLKKMDAGDNFYYLSGLLIGTELRESASKSTPITLVAAGELARLYVSAFKILKSKKGIQCVDSNLALIRGQLSILKHIR